MITTMAKSLGRFLNIIFDFFYPAHEPGQFGSGSVHLLRYSGIRDEIPTTRPNPHQSQLVSNSDQNRGT